MVPTPFTAAEIRDAMPVGTTVALRQETPGATPVVARWEVVDADDDAVLIEYTRATEDGVALTPPTRKRDLWTDLESHARFPAASTTRVRTSMATPLGTFEGWRYEVRASTPGQEPVPGAPPSDEVRTLFFADAWPGPPLVMTVQRGGQQVLRLEVVERTRP